MAVINEERLKEEIKSLMSKYQDEIYKHSEHSKNYDISQDDRIWHIAKLNIYREAQSDMVKIYQDFFE